MGALVLALNPSIDAEWRVARVQWEEKNVIQAERRWAGGKGVNVARWLRHLQGDSRLLLPVGGPTGKEFASYLREEKLPVKVILLRESTRVNVIVTTAAGRQMRFNPPGPKLSGKEWKKIMAETGHLLERAGSLVLSGSLPRGVDVGAYAELIRRGHDAGVKTVLDCDGEALRAAIDARPFLVKPNEHELAEWQGRPILSLATLIEAAFSMSTKTGGWVFVSRGGRGALLVNRKLNIKLSARPPRLRPVNTVGAGDAMVAAIAQQVEVGSAPEDWLRWGVAAGTAATQCAAGILPPVTLIEQIRRLVKVT